MPNGTGVEEVAVDGDEALRRDSSAPLVSVIVRSIGRPTLREALDSVARQTYPNIEVLVVDALGRGHPLVGESCGRFPLRVTGGGEPLSRSRAANAGLDAARGEYIGFLDDDDWFLPEHVQRLTAALESTPESPLAYAGVECRGSGGEALLTFDAEFSAGRLMAENYIPLHAALFRRSLVLRGCAFDEALEAYEDWDFWLQVLRYGVFAHVPRITAVYRVGGSSGVGMSPDPPRQARHRARVLEKWKERWSGEEVEAMVEALLERVRSEVASRQKRVAELEAEIALLTNGRLGRLWARFARRRRG